MEWNDPARALELLEKQVGLWRWEIDSGSLQWSDHLLEMLGLSREAFTGHFSFFEERLHPDDHGAMERAVDRHLRTGEPYQLRCRLLHGDGRYRTMVTQGASKSQAPKQRVLMGTALDISEQAYATEALAKSEESFRSMADNLPGALIRYIRLEDRSESVEFASAGCEAIWEATAEEIQRDPGLFWGMILEEDLEGIRASVAESEQSLAPWQQSWRIRTPSGKLKHLEGRGNPYRVSDGRVIWNTLIMDVSNAHALREELLRQQEMLGQAQKMESIGRIAGGIAHDFNNLLAIILGNAELCATSVRPDELHAIAADIIDACERGSTLTEGLLSFARQSRLSPSRLDVNAVVSRTAKLVARVIPESISVETIRPKDTWPVEADDTHLQSAIINLCINARDAMERMGGKLTIETANVHIDSDSIEGRCENIPPGRYVMIAVTDTGPGIAGTDLQRIVEPFYTTKALDRGSGLGLAMVDGFARQSDGALRIYSEPGHGTSVKIYLPSCGDAMGSDREADDAAIPAAPEGPSVLIVEDDDAVSSVLERALGRTGFRVETAASGDEALESFAERSREVDILLSDVVMPGMLQGPALAAALKERNPALCVIFMSGYPHEAAVRSQGLRPTDRFLMKPVGHRELVQAMHELLEQRDSADSA